MINALANGAADLCLNPQEISLFLNHHVYNGYGDCNISFAFKFLHLCVFFLLLLTFEKVSSTVSLSMCYHRN
jgi:hypothetical protein